MADTSAIVPRKITGPFIPDDFVYIAPTRDDLTIASIIWGFTLSTAIFACGKAFGQSLRVYKRTKGVSAYIAMLWAEIVVSTIIGVVTWLMIDEVIMPSFAVYFCIVALWVVQMQCIIGILINRLALLMVSRRNVPSMKWGSAAIIGVINVSVFVIWIPARLQISEEFVKVNNVWDRVEKAIFALLDLSLNGYFIYLVKTRLIANGLHKYTRLFNFNLVMIGVSVSLDIILIGTMSISNGFMYVQFHPLVYLLKLYIEMNMAEVIRKVVVASGRNENGSPYNANSHSHPGTKGPSGATHGATAIRLEDKPGHRRRVSGHDFAPFETHIGVASPDELDKGSNNNNNNAGGITRIVQTTVVSRRRRSDADDESSQASTRQLKEVAEGKESIGGDSMGQY